MGKKEAMKRACAVEQTQKDALVPVPLRARRSQVERAEKLRDSEGYEQLGPVLRKALDKGLDAWEREQRRRKQ
jgi:hypothetical protein